MKKYPQAVFSQLSHPFPQFLPILLLYQLSKQLCDRFSLQPTVTQSNGSGPQTLMLHVRTAAPFSRFNNSLVSQSGYKCEIASKRRSVSCQLDLFSAHALSGLLLLQTSLPFPQHAARLSPTAQSTVRRIKEGIFPQWCN